MTHDQPLQRSQSRWPAMSALFLLSFAFTTSLWHGVFFNFSLSSHMLPHPKSGLAGGLSLVYDGLMVVGWALPLFLAVLIILIFTPPSGALVPAFPVTSPNHTLRAVRIVLITGNFACLGLSLVATQIIGNPYAWPHEAYPGVPAWIDVVASLVGRAGMPAFWNMGWALVTALRYPGLAPIQSTLGLSYEHSIAIHRTLGWMTTFWLSVHGFGYLFVYFMQGIVGDVMMPGAHGSWFNFFALLGLACLSILAITSHFRVRRPSYSIFAMFHWLWLPFMLFSILHITSYAMVLAPPLFLFLVDRLACLFGTHAGLFGGSTVTATAIRVANDSVAILIPVGPFGANIIDQETLDAQLSEIYTPGRFMCLAFAGDTPGLSAAHPFSIAAYSVPNRAVAIMVRALGPWTKRVQDLASSDGAPIQLRISGPFSVSALAHKSDRVLVAGGIGISKYLGGQHVSDDIEINTVQVHKAGSSRSGSSSGRGSTEATPQPSVSTASDSARAGSITLQGGSDETMTTYGDAKFWLCKDATELAFYLAFGADLKGWQAHSSKGFDGEQVTGSAVLPSYPLYDQLKLAPPLSCTTRVSLYVLYIAIYTAAYLIARTALLAPDYTICAKTPTIQLWMWCQGRMHALFPFLVVLIGMPIVVQLAAVILVMIRASVRPASRFQVHDVALGLKNVRQVGRRFNFEQDVATKSLNDGVRVRTCTSKPVRAAIRSQIRVSGNVVMRHVDDGVGF